MVRLTTAIDLKSTSLNEEKDRQKSILRNLEDLKTQLTTKTADHEQVQEEYNSSRAEFQKQTDEVNEKEELLQTLQTGIASREGQESGYQGQLQQAKSRLSAATTEQEQAKLKIADYEKRIKEEEPRAKKAKDQNSGLLKNLEALRSHASQLESSFARLGLHPNQEEQWHAEQTTLERNIRDLSDKADSVRRKVSNIDFTYSDPSPNFDRSKVQGLVAQLFSLDKAHTSAGTALEICAGGRLYNVVVDSAETGTQLLQNGKLKKRVTIIPLNKIAAFRASAEVCKT